MPQLELIIFINQYNWTIISFLGLLLIVSNKLIPKTNSKLLTRKILKETGNIMINKMKKLNIKNLSTNTAEKKVEITKGVKKVGISYNTGLSRILGISNVS